MAHRLIYILHHAAPPPPEMPFVDHKDGNRSNNDINNLRAASRSNNTGNAKKRTTHGGKPTHSSLKGVSWNTKDKKWFAQLNSKHLGNFDTQEEAHEAYCNAADSAFGEFARYA